MAVPQPITELRKFGFVMAGAIAVVFGLVLPWIFNRPWPTWPFAVAGVFAAFALVWPRALDPVQRWRLEMKGRKNG